MREGTVIKIQIAAGMTRGGRVSTRTFSIKGIRDDITAPEASALVRAVSLLLASPVISARIVRKAVIYDRKLEIPAPELSRSVLDRYAISIDNINDAISREALITEDRTWRSSASCVSTPTYQPCRAITPCPPPTAHYQRA